MEKNELKQEEMPLFVLVPKEGFNKIFSVVETWGFMEELFSKNLESSVYCIQPILGLWEIDTLLQSNKLEAENLIADLMSWMHESTLKKLINSVKRDDGTYDLKSIESLKKQFEEYCAMAFFMDFKGGSCGLSKSVVSYFPFFKVKNNYAKKTVFLGDYSRETVILLKKILYVLYHFSFFSKQKWTYEQIDELRRNGSELRPITHALQVLAEATSDQLYDLFELSYRWDSKLLMEMLLDSLKYQNVITIKLFIDRIPLDYFMTINQLIGSNDFIANLVALKINLYRKSKRSRLTSADENVISACLSTFAYWIYKSNTEIRLHKCMNSCNATNQPFYKILDSDMQKALKDLLIKRYSFPMLMSLDINNDQSYLVLPAEELVDFCRAEGTSDGTFYFFDREGRLKAYSLKAGSADDGFRNKIFERAESHASNGCIIRISFGNNHNWGLAGDEKGIIRIYALNNSKNKNGHRITINPLPHWGTVTALSAQSSTIVAAYQSGALEMFDLKEFDHILHAHGEKKNHELVITCTPYDKEGWHELSGALANSTENNHCKLLAMDNCYVIAAYQNACIRLWKDKKFYREISLPQNSERQRGIEVMHIFSDDRLAVGCTDGTAYVIDLRRGYITHTIQSKFDTYEKSVAALTAMGENDHYLVVAHKDSQVYIWDLASKMNKPFKVIGADSYPLGVRVIPSNRALLEIIYVNATVNYVFIPELAQLEDVIKVLKNKDLSDLQSSKN